MGIWVRMRQALAVMDVVMKTWAVALGLRPTEVMVLMMAKERGDLCGAALARRSGRRRQSIHLTLRMLERRGVLRPTHTSPRGKVRGWGLTSAGEETLRRLEERMALWEGLLGERQDIDELAERLLRMVRTAVNRSVGGNGWQEGLSIPEELRRYPAWENAALKALVRREVEALRDARVPRDPGPGPRGVAPAGADEADDVVQTDKSEAAAWAAVEEAWLAMWR